MINILPCVTYRFNSSLVLDVVLRLNHSVQIYSILTLHLYHTIVQIIQLISLPYMLNYVLFYSKASWNCHEGIRNKVRIQNQQLHLISCIPQLSVFSNYRKQKSILECTLKALMNAFIVMTTIDPLAHWLPRFNCSWRHCNQTNLCLAEFNKSIIMLPELRITGQA